MNNELYHYGVKGMKWGVKKSVYKDMTKSQRRKAKKEYLKTEEGKQYKSRKKAAIKGAVIGGAAAAGAIAAAPVLYKIGKKTVDGVKNK